MSGFQGRSIFKNAYRSDIIRLVIVCGGLYALLYFIEITFLQTKAGTGFFIENIKNKVLLPLDINTFFKQPWSLLSFGFLDLSFWTLFTNLIWLWLFGSIIEDLKGTNRVFPIFWFGFIFGGLVLLLVHAFGLSSQALFASTLGGVSAVAFASVAYRPKAIVYSIFNKGVPVYIFGIVFLAISIYFNMHSVPTLVLFFAGGLLGFLSQNVLHSFFEKVRTLFTNARSYFSSNDNFIKEKTRKQSSRLDALNIKINEITDKLNANGLENLSKEEIEILKFHNKL